MEKTKVGDVTITIDDARAIRASVEKFLRTAKTADPVPPPSEPFIDCEGAVRLGPWILEWDDPDLRLAYRVAEAEYAIVREEVRIVRKGGRWKPVSTSQVIYHGRWER